MASARGRDAGAPGRVIGPDEAPRRAALLAELFGTQEIPATLTGRLLRTREVASLFQVSERTVASWARRGHLSSVRTPGGHRLYPADEVRRLLLAAGDGAVTEEEEVTTPEEEE